MPEGKNYNFFVVFPWTDYFIFIGFMIWGIFDNKAELKGVNFITLIYFGPGSKRVETFISVMNPLHTLLLWTLTHGHVKSFTLLKKKIYLIACLLNHWASFCLFFFF